MPQEQAEAYRQRIESGVLGSQSDAFPSAAMLQLLNDFALSQPERTRTAFMTTVASLRTLLEQYSNGIPGRTVIALLGIVRQYLNVERNFSGYQVSRISMFECMAALLLLAPSYQTSVAL